MYSRTWLLIVLAALLAFWARSAHSDAWFQSPVSPIAPDKATGAMPLPVVATPSPVVEEKPFPLFTASFWSSLWPWVAVGLVLFGGLAWGLTRLLRRVESWNK